MPRTLTGLMALRGVGPKMALIGIEHDSWPSHVTRKYSARHGMLHCNVCSDGRGLRSSVGSEHRHSPAPHAEPTGLGAGQAAGTDSAPARGLAATLGVAGHEPDVGGPGTGAADGEAEAVGQGGGVLGPPARDQTAQEIRHGREEGSG